MTSKSTSVHILDVYEEFIDTRYLTILRDDEFCYILDPMGSDQKNQLGKKIIRTGPNSFFLRPGESFEGGIMKVFILAEDEALLLRADEAHTEADGTVRNAVDRWMVHGPCRYTLPVEVKLLEKRKSIPLDTNEGIYIRDTREGIVRSVGGKTYMLEAHEELWEMPLDEIVEELLGFKGIKRDKTRVVKYKCDYNSAV